MKKNEERIKISDYIDVSAASSKALRLGEIAGFNTIKRYMVATAVSELGTNIYRYARDGEITIRILEDGTKRGIEIVAKDKGPGIADIEAAMQDNFSTSDSLGVGLPGAKRMMDEFEIKTKKGVGTKITARKWV
jgi:serine/threonine-protein kinase RsbT